RKRVPCVGAQERRVPLETSRSASVVCLGVERVAEVFKDDLGEVRIETPQRAEIGAGRLEHWRRRARLRHLIQDEKENEHQKDQREKHATAGAHGAARASSSAVTAAAASVTASAARVAMPAAGVAATTGIRMAA